MNLLFAIDKKFIPLFGTCIRSIVKNGGCSHYDAYILHSDFDEEAKVDTQNLAGEQVNCHFIDIDPTIFDGFPTTKRYPKQIYYRLAAPLLLPKNLDRILYLDVDLVVINPLKELYEMDFQDACYVGCSHTKEILTKINQVRIGAGEDAPYVNTGVLLMNLTVLRSVVKMDDIRSYAQEKMHTFILPDQDILAALYGDRIRLADTMKYNLSDLMLLRHNVRPGNPKLDTDWVRDNAVIIHYCGKNKPWKSNYIGPLGQFWTEQSQ